jgi:hypothetical protein
MLHDRSRNEMRRICAACSLAPEQKLSLVREVPFGARKLLSPTEKREAKE